MPKQTSLNSLKAIVDSIERGRSPNANVPISNSNGGTATATAAAGATRKEHHTPQQQQVSKAVVAPPVTTISEYEQFVGTTVANSPQPSSLETSSSSTWVHSAALLPEEKFGVQLRNSAYLNVAVGVWWVFWCKWHSLLKINRVYVYEKRSITAKQYDRDCVKMILEMCSFAI